MFFSALGFLSMLEPQGCGMMNAIDIERVKCMNLIKLNCL